MDKMKKKFKMPTAFTILFALIFVAAIFTYIIPAGTYDYADKIPVPGTYHLVKTNPQGLWDVFQAPIKGFKAALDVALFILILGGFLGIVFETKAIDSALGSILKKLNGKEKYLIPILMIFFAIGGTTYGMAEETIAFYPLIIPIVLAAGYDLVTVIMIIFLGSGVGVLGGLVDPFAVGIASELAGISIGEGIQFRLIALILGVSWAIIFTMRYAAKVKADPTKSITYDMNQKLIKKFNNFDSSQAIEITKKRKIVLIIFILTFVIMIISIIPWQYKFGINFFANLHASLIKIPVFKFFLGSMLPLGDWFFVEMSVLFLISSIIIAIFYRFPENKIIDLFMAGAKDLLSVALILGVARGISIILNDGMIIGTILHSGEMALTNVNKAVFAIGSYLLYIPLTFLIPSTSGLATASMPIIAPLADFAGVGREVVVMAFQSGAETMNFISPTQCVLVGALAITGVPYSRWLKAIRPFLLGIIVIVFIVLTLATYL
ncbi:YfcC family protein [Haloimpatiens sp. FM7315]|uniref:YfcC family protein n=1 Tax=Haloimpatiens sp. FM7315 TaxID=3298609 RepID=UPI00370A6618